MAADNEGRLLSRAIRDRDLKPLLERGIDESWFVVDEHRTVFTFVRDHWQKYGEVPTAVTVKDNYPNYRVLNVEDTIEYLVDQLVAFRRRQQTIRMLQDASEMVSEGHDHEAALETITTSLAKIQDTALVVGQDRRLTADPLSRFEDYLALKSRPDGLLGIPTGFATIDEATAGLQPGQLITFIAPPKTGKSVLGMQVMCNLHDAGHSGVLQSFEMSNDEQTHRHDAMRAHVAHSRLTRGQLRPDEETRLRKMLRRLEKMPNELILTDSVSAMTVSAFAAKLEKIKPAVAMVDGVYLMIDEISGEANTPQALTNITRALKRLAQRQHIPIVITTQVLLWKMKGKKVSADAIGYSSSFFQDSDVILGLERPEDDEDGDADTRILKIVASRNCGPASVELEWDWEHGVFREPQP